MLIVDTMHLPINQTNTGCDHLNPMWKLHSRTSIDEIELLLWYVRCYKEGSLRTKINNLVAGGNIQKWDE